MTHHKTLCIHHHPCADGTAAAWVVRQALGNQVEFHPGVYGEAPPDVTGRDVILVDFSYKREPLIGLIEQARSVLIIDHHKTAQEDLADLPGNVVCIFDMARCGAMLAWHHFFPNQSPPLLLDHIQDRDLWHFKLPMTREIMAAVFSYPTTIDSFDELILRKSVRDLENEGRPLIRKQQKDIDDLLKLCTRPMVIGGYTVPVANLPYTIASEAAVQLAEGMPFAATYYDGQHERVFSLRSTDSGVDVSAIARQYGGGGHRNAAGFRVNLRSTAAALPALPGIRPETIGVELTLEDMDRLERATEQLQAAAPDLSVDDCVNSIFLTGLAMMETKGGGQKTAALDAAAHDLLKVVEELEESAAYWSDYDVPLGIVDRINAALKKARGL